MIVYYNELYDTFLVAYYTDRLVVEMSSSGYFETLDVSWYPDMKTLRSHLIWNPFVIILHDDHLD